MTKFVSRLGAVLMMASALSAASTTVTGTLSNQAGKFMMVDDASNASFEIQGKGLRKLVGSRVTVTGELVNGVVGSTPVVELTSATKVAAAAGKSGAAGKTAAAGIKSGVPKYTLLAAGSAAAAGTVAGLYAADVVGADEQPASRR